MIDVIPHDELVHRIMKDCNCPRSAAETIANLLEQYEEDFCEPMEYDKVAIRSSYVYYPSVTAAYEDQIGDKDMPETEDDMTRILEKKGYDIHRVGAGLDEGIVLQLM